jgi:type II secretory pathway component PulF
LATFEYKGVDSSGQAIDGTIEAVDRKAAISELAAGGRFVQDILEQSSKVGLFKKSRAGSPAGKVSNKEVLAMTSQLATALGAGLPILNALEIIKSQQKKEQIHQLLAELVEAVSSGQSLSEAMERHPEIFSGLYLSMVRVGETGGILDKTMNQLVLLMSREEKIRSNLISASAYPLFVLFAGLVSMVIILVGVLPKIIKTIGVEAGMLPLPTRMLMGLSHFLVSFGWLVAIGLGFGIYGFIKWRRSDEGQMAWDAFKLKLPLFGSVVRSLAVGRFARTLGSLAESGVTIIEALQVVRDTLGNEVLARQIDEVVVKVKTGSNLADPLEGSGLFPALLVQIVAMGEQTGQLDKLLLNAADTFDEQADSVMQRFVAVFPAVLILILALLIFFIIMATLLPIMTMDMTMM